MITTSTAVRRRIALLAQQRPSLDGNRQQQQEGSTDFQWLQDAVRPALPNSAAVRSGLAKLPSHRQPARAPVIGATDDCRHEGPPASTRRSAVPRMHEFHAASEAVAQQS